MYAEAMCRAVHPAAGHTPLVLREAGLVSSRGIHRLLIKNMSLCIVIHLFGTAGHAADSPFFCSGALFALSLCARYT